MTMYMLIMFLLLAWSLC